MILDDLGLMRGDGSSPTISTTEAGYNSLTRHAGTGRAVIPVYKTGKNGIPVVGLFKPSGVTLDRGFVVTIEACDAVAFASDVDVVATFPVTDVTSPVAATMIRRVHTQKRYLRSVITCTVAGSTGTADFLIFVTEGLMDT